MMEPGFKKETADELCDVLEEHKVESINVEYQSEYMVISLNQEGIKQLIDAIEYGRQT